VFRPWPVYIGLRYTRARRRNHFVSFISLSSMLGIALGVAALITVLSVMNGFQEELRQRILGVVAHLTVEGEAGPLEGWRRLLGRLEGLAHVRGVAPYVRGEGMLRAGGASAGVILRGVDPALEPRVSDLAGEVVAGDLAALRPGGWGIVLGQALAARLGVWVGDRVVLMVPQATVTPAGLLPRLRRLTVVGVFEAGMYEYDSALALMHLEDATRLLRLGDGVTGLRLRLDELFRAPALARRLAAELGPSYAVGDWTERHANFFKAVRMEKTVMFVILTLIVAVAAFNIVSTLVMVVRDKEADIAVLRTLGATPRQVMGVFVVQGSVLGVAGTLLGVAGGVALALHVEQVVQALEGLLGVRFLPADVYYISELPSRLDWGDVGRITAVSLLLSVSATLYPAWRAARVQPAEALRYE